MTSHRVALEVKVDVHVLAEPTRVIVAICLGVTERLQNTVGLQQNILHSEIQRKLNSANKIILSATSNLQI